MLRDAELQRQHTMGGSKSQSDVYLQTVRQEAFLLPGNTIAFSPAATSVAEDILSEKVWQGVLAGAMRVRPECVVRYTIKGSFVCLWSN